jgi:hypothetical protein
MLTVSRTFLFLAFAAVLLCIGCALTEPTAPGQKPNSEPSLQSPLLTVNSDVLYTVLGIIGGLVTGWLGLKRPGDTARPTASPLQSPPTVGS